MPFRADNRIIARTGVLLAFAVIIGYLEFLIMPPAAVPGMRLGVANIVVIVALYVLGLWSGLVVSCGKVLLVSLLTGTLASPVFVLSLSGALASFAAMAALRSCGSLFSVVGWSVAGSAAHVSAQIAVACVYAGSFAPLTLVPLSLGLSLPSGLVVGYGARLLLSRRSFTSVSVA